MQFTDQMHRTISLGAYPQRIVSLVPSQSELLWDLGLQQQLAGITKFCVHPGVMFNSVTRIGGTKTLDLEKIRALEPDLIIGNKEENEQKQVEQLMKEFTVWMSDINTYPQALDMISGIGRITNTQAAAGALRSGIEDGFDRLKGIFKDRPSVLYLIWKGPYMAAGSNTFIDDMLGRIGLRNCAAQLEGRYPELTPPLICELKPDLVFLSSEPYPFKDKHVSGLQALLPQSKIVLVDGEMFSWYGSRMKKAPQYLQGLIRSLS